MIKLKSYIVYDGRAEYDVDSASIVEYMGEYSEKQARRLFFKEWGDHGCILYAYDSDGENIKNGSLVARSKNIGGES